MPAPAATLRTVFTLLVAVGIAGAQQEPRSEPAANGAAAAPNDDSAATAPLPAVIAPGAGVSPGRSVPPGSGVAGREDRPTAGPGPDVFDPAPVPPPRARVSIVRPQQSPVYKHHGMLTQDDAGAADGAAQDAPVGPTIERLD